MNARLIDLDTDYEDLSLWWASHKFPVIPREILPKLGVMIQSDDGTKLAGGFVYMDNSVGVCWMEWLVTNHRNRPTVSLIALQALIDGIKSVVLSQSDTAHHYGVIMTTLRQQSLARLYEKHGFQRTDDGVSHFICLVPKPEEVAT